MTTHQKRRRFTAEQKVSILRKHLVEGTPVSDVCEESGIKPAQYYSWQKQFFENGAAAFQNGVDEEKRELTHEIAQLKQKLAGKDAVIAEVAEAFVTLKKELGES